MNDKVWIVTSGDYSDYSVFDAFASESLAEAFCERENAARPRSYDEFRVEELRMFTELPEAWISKHASASLMPDGSLADIRFWDGYGREYGDVEPSEVRRDLGVKVELRVNYHRTMDEAKKALYDLAARVKAEREGIA